MSENREFLKKKLVKYVPLMTALDRDIKTLEDGLLLLRRRKYRLEFTLAKIKSQMAEEELL